MKLEVDNTDKHWSKELNHKREEDIPMLNQALGSVVEIKEVVTLVDFYQYIKGVEYLICIAFFVGFPMFYRYINKDESKHG